MTEEDRGEPPEVRPGDYIAEPPEVPAEGRLAQPAEEQSAGLPGERLAERTEGQSAVRTAERPAGLPGEPQGGAGLWCRDGHWRRGGTLPRSEAPERRSSDSATAPEAAPYRIYSMLFQA